MIEILIVVGLGLLTERIAHTVKSRRLCLTQWLSLRDTTRVLLPLYIGNPDYARVKCLVRTLGFFCEKTAACTHYVQAREALFYARNATMVLSELHGLGFFEKTQRILDACAALQKETID